MTNTRSYLVLLLCVLFSAGPLYAGKSNCIHHGAGEDIYKHYTGTIGDRKVALDLKYGYCGASNYGGSFVYDLENGDVKNITIYQPASFDHSSPLHAKEHFTEDTWTNDNPRPTWDFTIAGDKLTGKWQSADKKRSYDINLTEDYKTSYQLDVLIHEDSVKAFLPNRSTSSAQYVFIGVKPGATLAKDDADFISTQLSAMVGGDKAAAGNIQLMPAILAHKELDEFRLKCRRVAPADSVAIKNVISHPYNNKSTVFFPAYNDNGFLIMQCTQFSFTFYGSANSCSYSCIDVARKKVWKLNDILKTDNTVLTKLLKDAYKKTQQATGDENLLNKIASTDNFILMNKGLVFCCPIKDGSLTNEVKIFIPYEKLNTMLTKEFKERMSL